MVLNDITFYYKNDQRPHICTVIQDYYVIFDAYDSAVDSTLQESKTLVKAQVNPAFTLSDVFVPNLDDQQFPLLLNEAKALAFFEIKQQPHQKAEQEARRQWIHSQKEKDLHTTPGFDQLPKFGRC